MVYNLNSKKWEYLFKVYQSEYNPIENTDFVETYNDTTISDKTGNNTTVSNGTATTTGSGTNTGNNTANNNVYGFNSAAAVGDSQTTGNNTDTTATNSQTISHGDSVDNSHLFGNDVHTSTHKKSGNIGVTSTTELMQGTIDFWQKWSFIDDICKDICNVIALSIY